MKLEHFAIDVPDAEAFIAWWCKNLGMRRSAPGSAFIMDDSGTVGLEVYRTGETPAAPDYRAMNSMTLHVAFASDDVAADGIAEFAGGNRGRGRGVAHGGSLVWGKAAVSCAARVNLPQFARPRKRKNTAR